MSGFKIKINGINTDLDDIFKPYDSNFDKANVTTYFKTSNGNDLKDRYMAYSTPYNNSIRAQTTNFSYSNNDLNMYFLSKSVKVPYVLNYTKTEPNGSWGIRIIYGTDSIAYCFYPNNPTNNLWSSKQTMMLNNFYLTIGDTTKKPSDVTPQKSPNVDIYIVSAGAPGSYYGDGGGGGH